MDAPCRTPACSSTGSSLGPHVCLRAQDGARCSTLCSRVASISVGCVCLLVLYTRLVTPCPHVAPRQLLCCCAGCCSASRAAQASIPDPCAPLGAPALCQPPPVCPVARLLLCVPPAACEWGTRPLRLGGQSLQAVPPIVTFGAPPAAGPATKQPAAATRTLDQCPTSLFFHSPPTHTALSPLLLRALFSSLARSLSESALSRFF